MKHGKKYTEAAKQIDRQKLYEAPEALALVKKSATAKFDETVEIHIRTGCDSRHADQQIRGAVVLPHGTGKTVRVFIDSQYVKNGITGWIANWKRNGWKTATGEPVQYLDLWRALDEAFSLRTVRFHWVKGHAGHPENERCDVLATTAADDEPSTLLHDDGGDLR